MKGRGVLRKQEKQNFFLPTFLEGEEGTARRRKGTEEELKRKGREGNGRGTEEELKGRKEKRGSVVFFFYLPFSQEESKRAEYTLHGCLNAAANESEPLKIISTLSKTLEKSHR